jgi:hypothetical protein
MQGERQAAIEEHRPGRGVVACLPTRQGVGLLQMDPCAPRCGTTWSDNSITRGVGVSTVTGPCGQGSLW